MISNPVNKNWLVEIPLDVLRTIFDSVNLEDVFNLSLACKQLQYVIAHEKICESVLKTHVPYCNAVLEANSGGYAKVLRREIKTRRAVAQAEPYLIAIVGSADNYIFTNGVLCYVIHNDIRILDLHHSACDEIVFNKEWLLEALPEGHEKGGIIRVLYYADSILTCIYRSRSTNYLIVLSTLPEWSSKRILAICELDSTKLIFSRNNKTHLYYGTWSELNRDDNQLKWAIYCINLVTQKKHPKIILYNLTGSDIDIEICFELHNNYFYALSTLPLADRGEVADVSVYQCWRVCLELPQNRVIKTDDRYMWRRDHVKEGPLDNRWASLHLEVNEKTGELNIVEIRRACGEESKPCCYITPVIFLDNLGSLSFQQLPQTQPRFYVTTNSTDFEIHSHYYHSSSNTHIDLVKDLRSSNSYVCICAESRRLRPSEGPDIAVKEIYQVRYWPRPQNSNSEIQHVDTFHHLLDSSLHVGKVKGTMDGRCLVYSIGDHPKTLVVIGFDPGMRLEGIEQWKKQSKRRGHTAVEKLQLDGNMDTNVDDQQKKTENIRKERAMYQDINAGVHFCS